MLTESQEILWKGLNTGAKENFDLTAVNILQYS